MAANGEGGGRRRAGTGNSKLSVEEQFDALMRDAPKEAAKSEGDVFELPPWFDADKFRRGQRYFAYYYFSMFVCKLIGLVFLLAIPSVLNILVRTKRSSTPITSFRRYLSTLLHMVEWYEGDLTDPKSRAYRSLREVRARHSSAASSVGHISQLDMALTQFAFMGFQLIYPKKFGFAVEGQDDFVHFWRVIGYLIGIDDKYNLCREEGREETSELCNLLLQRVFIPALRQPPEDFVPMASALLEGVWVLVVVVDYDTFFAFAYDILELPYTTKNLSAKTRFFLYLHESIQSQVMPSPWLPFILRPILNNLLWCSIFIAKRFQIIANITLSNRISPVPQNVCLVT